MKRIVVLGLVCLLAGCSSSGDDIQGGGQAISGPGASPAPAKGAPGVTPAAKPAGGTFVPIACTLSVGGGTTRVVLASSADGSLTGSASAPDDDGTSRKWDVFISGRGADFTTFQIDLANDNGPVTRSVASQAGLGPNDAVQLVQFFNHSREDEVDVACTLNAE